MSLTDKIVEKIAGALGWLLLKELRRIASGIEKGIDSHREIHGFRPLFQTPLEAANEVIAGEQAEAAQAVADNEPTNLSSEGGDYMRQEILELLAGENRIPITPETDLVALGKDRGWLDNAGQVVMLPQGYGD